MRIKELYDSTIDLKFAKKLAKLVCLGITNGEMNGEEKTKNVVKREIVKLFYLSYLSREFIVKLFKYLRKAIRKILYFL